LGGEISSIEERLEKDKKDGVNKGVSTKEEFLKRLRVVDREMVRKEKQR